MLIFCSVFSTAGKQLNSLFSKEKLKHLWTIVIDSPRAERVWLNYQKDSDCHNNQHHYLPAIRHRVGRCIEKYPQSPALLPDICLSIFHPAYAGGCQLQRITETRVLQKLNIAVRIYQCLKNLLAHAGINEFKVL